MKFNSKDIYNVTKLIFQINTELSIHQRIVKKNVLTFFLVWKTILLRYLSQQGRTTIAVFK